MAVEIQGTLSISHGGVTAAGSETKSYELDVSGKKTVVTQALSTTLADLNIGAITWSEATWLWIKNLSSITGEDVTITKSAIEIGVLKPGESYGPIRVKADGTAMRAKSATGTPTIQIVAAGALA